MGCCISNKDYQPNRMKHDASTNTNIKSAATSSIDASVKQITPPNDSLTDLKMGNGSSSVNQKETGNNANNKKTDPKKSNTDNNKGKKAINKSKKGGKDSSSTDESQKENDSNHYDSVTNPYCLADVNSFDDLPSVKIHKPGWKEDSNGATSYNIFIAESVGMNLVKKLKSFPRAVIVPHGAQLTVSKSRFCGIPVVVISIKNSDPNSQERDTIERYIHQLRHSGPREFAMPEASYDVDIGNEQISREQMEYHHRSMSLKEIKPLNRD